MKTFLRQNQGDLVNDQTREEGRNRSPEDFKVATVDTSGGGGVGIGGRQARRGEDIGRGEGNCYYILC